MPRKSALALLQGEDRRTIGHSDQVVAIVANRPELFAELIAGPWSEDPVSDR